MSVVSAPGTWGSCGAGEASGAGADELSSEELEDEEELEELLVVEVWELVVLELAAAEVVSVSESCPHAANPKGSSKVAAQTLVLRALKLGTDYSPLLAAPCRPWFSNAAHITKNAKNTIRRHLRISVSFAVKLVKVGRVHLNRAKILDAAVSILDEYGLSDLTMRRLARHLEVAPGAVYWHVAHKQELIALVARRIVEPALHPEEGAQPVSEDSQPSAPSLPSPHDWCEELRRLLLLHRDGAEIVAAATAMSSLREDLHATVARILATAFPGLSAADRRHGAATIVQYMLGAVVLEQSANQARELSPADGSVSLAEDIDTARGIEIILTGLRQLSENSPA